MTLNFSGDKHLMNFISVALTVLAFLLSLPPCVSCRVTPFWRAARCLPGRPVCSAPKWQILSAVTPRLRPYRVSATAGQGLLPPFPRAFSMQLCRGFSFLWRLPRCELLLCNWSARFFFFFSFHLPNFCPNKKVISFLSATYNTVLMSFLSSLPSSSAFFS